MFKLEFPSVSRCCLGDLHGPRSPWQYISKMSRSALHDLTTSLNNGDHTGNDSIDGGKASDTIFGGSGNDLLKVGFRC